MLLKTSSISGKPVTPFSSHAAIGWQTWTKTFRSSHMQVDLKQKIDKKDHNMKMQKNKRRPLNFELLTCQGILVVEKDGLKELLNM